MKENVVSVSQLFRLCSVKALCHTPYIALLTMFIYQQVTTNHQVVFLCLNLSICFKGVLQRQCTNKLRRPARSPNILLLVHQRQAEVPAHIVMEDMSSWLVVRSNNTLRERQWRDEIKRDEDPANLTRELNILILPGRWSRMLLMLKFGEKQTTSLMRSDVTLGAPLRLTTKLQRE